MGTFVNDWLDALWMVLVESGPYLLVGFAIAGLLSVLVPARVIARRLGGDDLRSVATASLIGVPVPLCSCSVIPTATQLRRAGASRGATTSFLISTPETGVDSIGATWALMDPLMTVVRPVAAFATAFASGVAVNLFGRPAPGERPPLDEPERPAAKSCCSHTAAEETAGEPARDHEHVHDGEGGPVWRRTMRYAFGTLLDDLAPWFLIGFAISGLIVVAVPDGFFAGALFTGLGAMLAMLVAGVPLYVCATASTPIAAAMMAKGLEPGAALVFLLAGPATNVATILVVRDLLGRRALAIYLGCIGLFALMIGAVVNRLYPLLGLDPTAMQIDPGAMDHGAIGQVSGAILGALLLASAVRQRLDRRAGAWLRRVCAPLRLDPTTGPVKAGALAVAVALYASTAVTAVPPGTTVFVERFGAVTEERRTPGLVVHAPWPVGRTRAVPTALVRSEPFGVDRGDVSLETSDALRLAAETARLRELDAEAEMLTGDGGVVAISYAVQYRVRDARRWTFGSSDPEALVRALAQEAIRQSTSRRTVEDLLSGRGVALAPEVERTLSASFERTGCGAELVSVELQSVHAPRGVHGAFRAIATALVDAKTLPMVEQRKRTELLAESRINAERIETRARLDALEAIAVARGRADAFYRLAEVWDLDPEGVEALLLQAANRAGLERDGARRTAVLSPHVQVIPGPAPTVPAARSRPPSPTGDSR